MLRRNDSPARARRGDEGYSLIEVLAASVLLAGVLISIMTMFIYGGQNINSGKLTTKATSIANDVLEEFRSRKFRIVPDLLEDSQAATDASYEWASDTFMPNAPLDGSPEDLVLEEWAQIVEDELPEGRIVVSVRGLAGLGSNPTTEPFATADVLQIVVTVEWRDKRRDRSVVFQILKV